jgi:hypothetical protein
MPLFISQGRCKSAFLDHLELSAFSEISIWDTPPKYPHGSLSNLQVSSHMSFPHTRFSRIQKSKRGLKRQMFNGVNIQNWIKMHKGTLIKTLRAIFNKLPKAEISTPKGKEVSKSLNSSTLWLTVPL